MLTYCNKKSVCAYISSKIRVHSFFGLVYAYIIAQSIIFKYTVIKLNGTMFSKKQIKRRKTMKIKKITAVLSLAAVMATSGSAFAAIHYTNPNNHGTWKYGTTGAIGGGFVISEYYDRTYNYSYASVVNALGKRNSDTTYRGWARTSLPAYTLGTDRAYYNFWN